MATSHLMQLLVVLIAHILGTQGQAINCSRDQSCGENSECTPQFMCSCTTNGGLYFSPTGLNNDCRAINDPDPRCAQYDQDCVYCGSNFEGPCLKCAEFIMESSQSCVSECQGEFRISSILTDLTSRACEESSGSSSNLPGWAVIVIPVVAVVLVLIVVGVVIAIAVSILGKSKGQFDVEDSHRDVPDSAQTTLRTKRSNSFSYHRQENSKDNKDSSAGHKNPAFQEIEGDDKTVFLHRLDYLRSQAEIFLKMLNDMRRRLKELPPDAPAAQQYRNVMQDVTRLLYLLNKKPSKVEMPPDGLQLLKWSQQILERYLASQGMAPKPWQTNRLSVLGPQDETQF